MYSKQKRELPPTNNLYIKKFNPDWTERELREVFEKYGDILSIHL